MKKTGIIAPAVSLLISTAGFCLPGDVLYTGGRPEHNLRLYVNKKSRDISKGLPRKTILGKNRLRRITAAAFSPGGRRLYIAFKFAVYMRDITKKRWTRLSWKGMNKYASLTALVVSGGSLYAGTSCYGVYRYRHGRWRSMNRGLPGEGRVYRRHFYETVTALGLGEKGQLYAGLHFGRGIYCYVPGKARWQRVNFRKKLSRPSAILRKQGVLFIHDGKTWVSSRANTPLPLVLRQAGQIFSRLSLSGAAYIGGRNISFTKEAIPRRRRRLIKKAANRRGLYFNPWRARPGTLRGYIRRMKKKKMNMLVVDVKDDYGRVLYPSRLTVVRRVGAVYPILKVKQLVRLCKKENIYLVARLVTFKDPRLHRYKKGKYAVRDRYHRGIWNPGSREKWVDAFNPFVRAYNIKIANEILSLGFDEIQFDYIRFPTDGPIYRTWYPAKPKNAWKLDALENFLAAVCRSLKGPFSVDIYGFSGWYAMGSWMGQDIALFSAYADVISSMMYPSHFDRDFRIEKGRAKQAYRILYHGTRRARQLTGGQVYLRPYLQAFRWRAYRYGRKYWEDQIRGVYNAGSRGYIFWDAASRYGFLSLLRYY